MQIVFLERWPSGLRRTLGKRVSAKVLRGFESLPLYYHHLFMSANKNLLFLLLVSSIIVLISPACKKGYQDRFGPFYILNDTTIVMNGDMGSRVDNQFDRLIAKYPNIKLMIMEDCPGSRNDEQMFKAALQLHNLSINTHLPSNGKIQSGAVDLYLSGNKRTLEQGAKIGIHAWSDGSGSATDYPTNHSEHELYINFYKAIGCSQQEAEDLYFFIINAAAPEDIHWMTDQEIDQFNITNP